jgi:PadR family transcriptional regulator PadR
METQLKKGVLEMCALSLLSKKDMYGYDLVSSIKLDISEGTIYPLLRRLSINGLVTTYLKESKSGPARKYYKLTKEGKTEAKNLVKEWKIFSKQVDKVIE